MTSLFDDLDVELLPSMRLRNRHTAERLASDLLPVCPHCGDFNFPGLARCESCCSPLFKRLGRGAVTGSREGVRQHVALTQPRPTCPTCLVECDEDGYCNTCGREKAA